MSLESIMTKEPMSGAVRLVKETNNKIDGFSKR